MTSVECSLLSLVNSQRFSHRYIVHLCFAPQSLFRVLSYGKKFHCAVGEINEELKNSLHLYDMMYIIC